VSGLDAALTQDALDGIATQLVADVAERAANARVAPARVLGRQLNDQALDQLHGRRATWISSGTAVVLLRDELAVPAQDRVGRDDAVDLVQHLAAEHLALPCEPTSLSIREAEAPTTELFAQHTVLFLEVREDLELATVGPPREQQQQEPERRDRDGARVLPREATKGAFRSPPPPDINARHLPVRRSPRWPRSIARHLSASDGQRFE
jgi:hypothetical protein